MTSRLLTLAVVLCAGAPCVAQSGRPITSLPKAPGDTTASRPVPDAPATNVPAAADPAPAVAPAYVPPAASAPIPGMGSEVLAPSPATAITPAAAPVMTPSAPVAITPQPVAQPAPAETYTPAPLTAAPAPAPTTPDLGPAPLRGAVLDTPAPERREVRQKPHFGPGSAIAVQLKAGFAGAGIDVATPLAQRLNLRAGASFFQYSGSYDIDGTHIDGEAKFRSATVQLDIFPFGGGFRISPGVTVYNGNNLNAAASVAGNAEFDLGDDSFTSAPYDPVKGTASMTFGNRTAPSLTIGWGNMIPRSNRHLSFPFEIGVQYLGDAPQIHLDLHGTACGTTSAGTGCEQVQTDPQIQQDIRDEENSINSTIRPLRFYPIISFGVAWAFHIGKR